MHDLLPMTIDNSITMGISSLTPLQQECVWNYVRFAETFVCKQSGQAKTAGSGINKDAAAAAAAAGAAAVEAGGGAARVGAGAAEAGAQFPDAAGGWSWTMENT